jgi:hypothetical protein
MTGSPGPLRDQSVLVGQSVIPHGIDRELTADEFADGKQS